MGKKKETEDTQATGVGETADGAADDTVVRCRCVKECSWQGMIYEGDVIELPKSSMDESFFREHFKII